MLITGCESRVGYGLAKRLDELVNLNTQNIKSNMILNLFMLIGIHSVCWI